MFPHLSPIKTPTPFFYSFHFLFFLNTSVLSLLSIILFSSLCCMAFDSNIMSFSWFHKNHNTIVFVNTTISFKDKLFLISFYTCHDRSRTFNHPIEKRKQQRDSSIVRSEGTLRISPLIKLGNTQKRFLAESPARTSREHGICPTHRQSRVKKSWTRSLYTARRASAEFL